MTEISDWTLIRTSKLPQNPTGLVLKDDSRRRLPVYVDGDQIIQCAPVDVPVEAMTALLDAWKRETGVVPVARGFVGNSAPGGDVRDGVRRMDNRLQRRKGDVRRAASLCKFCLHELIAGAEFCGARCEERHREGSMEDATPCEHCGCNHKHAPHASDDEQGPTVEVDEEKQMQRTTDKSAVVRAREHVCVNVQIEYDFAEDEPRPVKVYVPAQMVEPTALGDGVEQQLRAYREFVKFPGRRLVDDLPIEPE